MTVPFIIIGTTQYGGHSTATQADPGFTHHPNVLICYNFSLTLSLREYPKSRYRVNKPIRDLD